MSRRGALSAANHAELKEKTELFPYWEYRTAGDRRVRREHQALDGVILPSSDPKWKQIYPPNGWNCRCYVVPRMAHQVAGMDLEAMQQHVEDYQQTRDWKSAVTQGWGTNRAELSEIFNANQQYVYKLPTNSARSIDDLHAEHYGLPTIDHLMGSVTQKAPVYTPPTPPSPPRNKQEAKEIRAQQLEAQSTRIWEKYSSKERGCIVLPDYAGRKIILTEKSFLDHTKEKGSDNRIAHWDAMLETLASPDEVWSQKENTRLLKEKYKDYRKGIRKGGVEPWIQQDNYSLIKYYKDKIIVANYQIVADELHLSTWYELAQKKSVINRKRRGILIKGTIRRLRRKPNEKEADPNDESTP